MISDTERRVPAHTPAHLNERIEREIEDSVYYYAHRLRATGRTDEIDARLGELDREWDIERTLEANAATITLFGIGIAAAADDRRWLMLPAAVAGFLLQHAVQGWCPPVPMFRRLGVRTAGEIDRERYALKALRGDFDELSRAGDGRARKVLDAVRA